MSKQGRVFAALCALSAVAVGFYVFHASTRVGEPAAPASIDDIVSRAAEGAPRRIFFRYTSIDNHYGALAFADLASRSQPQFVEGLHCEVVSVGGSRGLCLTADRGVFTTYAAHLFDAQTFKVFATIPLQGIPSRCRVSADGKLAALTVFVTGHSYASLDFSTQTLLIDTADARVIADVEDFSVTRDGQSFSKVDFNFWGVTFTDDGRTFYATLSTGRQHFLVRADIAARSAVVIHDNVECPSLSPNGKRIAYKKRIVTGARIGWQLYTLDLGSGRETPLAEKRSVDDQLEWLDDDYVLYSTPATTDSSSASTDVWLAAADDASPPRRLLQGAYSPSIER